MRYARKHAEELLHQDEYAPRELASLLGTTEDYLIQELWRGALAGVQFSHDIYQFKRRDVLERLSRRERVAG